MNAKNLFKENNFEETIPKFQKFIDLQYLHYIICYCCCKSKFDRFSKIHSLVKQGSDELEAELDIVRFVRRVRSYGIALYYLTTRQQRIITTRMAAYKPLRNEKYNDTVTSWATIHNQNFEDRLRHSFFRRFAA